jgi:hypothetical protein
MVPSFRRTASAAMVFADISPARVDAPNPFNTGYFSLSDVVTKSFAV